MVIANGHVDLEALKSRHPLGDVVEAAGVRLRGPGWAGKSRRRSRGLEQSGKRPPGIPLTPGPLARPGVGPVANRNRLRLQLPKERQPKTSPRR